MKLKFNIGIVSDVGMVRTNNEDNFYAPEVGVKGKRENNYSVPKTLHAVHDKAFYAVCDGMGGMNAGEEAAWRTVKSVEKSYTELCIPEKQAQVRALHNRIICDISEDIFDASLENPDFRNMGCTLCSIYFCKGKAIVSNVGDSRVYVLKKKSLEQLTLDHTDPTIRKGALTKYMGMNPEYGVLRAHFGHEPIKITRKTRFLLCTDGLNDMVPDREIENILTAEHDPQKAAERLATVAKNYGGMDNITCMVIDAMPGGNIFVRLARRKSTYAALALAAAVAFGGAYTYNTFINNADKPNIELSEGMTLDDIKQASSWNEKKKLLGEQYPTCLANKASVDSLSESITKGAYSMIAADTSVAELGTAISEYNTAYENYTKAYAEIDTIAADDTTAQENIILLGDTLVDKYNNVQKKKSAADKKLAEAVGAAEAKAKADAEKKDDKKADKKDNKPSGTKTPVKPTSNPVTPTPAPKTPRPFTKGTPNASNKPSTPTS